MCAALRKGDATEPFHSQPYSYAPVPDEPDMARHREKLKSAGLNPASLPLGVDIERWLKGGRTPWDAFPDTRSGKMDAESCPLALALASANVTLQTGSFVETLETSADGKTIIAVNALVNGEKQRLTPKIVILSAGAVNSAALLLRSANARLSKRPCQFVGSGRPQFHEPQSDGVSRHASV